MPLNTDTTDKRWEGIVRASIISANINKLVGYIQLADQKAMGVIVLNSIIIPIVLSKINADQFKIAATLSIMACITSMFVAIICIFPKRRAYGKPDGTVNPFHYSDIGRMTEAEYLDIMQPIYNSPPDFAVASLKDLHDVSRYVLVPKFFWLKLSYIIFFLGNFSAIAIEILHLWAQ